MQNAVMLVNRLPAWGLALASGVLLGVSAPGFGLQFAGLVSLLPLFLAFDRINDGVRLRRKIWRMALLCWVTGTVSALLAANWIIHSAHVFGHLPYPLAVFPAVFYGIEVTCVLFLLTAVPCLFSIRPSPWETSFRLFWLLLWEPQLPTLFHWSFGGMTFSAVPLVAQAADVVGASGLGFFPVGTCLLGLLAFRKRVNMPGSHAVWPLGLGCLALATMALVYGAVRPSTLEPSESSPRLHLASLQPNFSLARLASNPDLAYSTRERNLNELLSDSRKALAHFPVDSQSPRLIVWPESTLPGAYLKHDDVRGAVSRFARREKTYVLLTSIDWSEEGREVRYYGASFLIGPDGEVAGRYNKMFLIPFGEYNPFKALIPPLDRWLRDNVRNMSEFERGREFAVFETSGAQGESLKLSAPICFDVFSPEIIRSMSRGGAEFVVVLSNLAWFGKTIAKDLMEMAARWRAIENRVPVLLASNNGTTISIDARGQTVGQPIPLFEEGIYVETVSASPQYSFYRENRRWVEGFFLVGALASAVGIRRRRHRKISEESVESSAMEPPSSEL